MVARNTPGACGRKLGAWDLALETWRLGPGVCGPGPTRRPGLLFVARAAQYAADDILREAAAGQEARLLGIGRAVGRLSPKRLRQTSSARSCSVDRSWSRNSATWPSSTPCWRSSCTMRAALARRAPMHEALRETLGGQPAFLFQRVQHRLDLGRIFGMRRQLAGQFGARMLAARQIAHGAHLQRRPLALGLAAIGLRTALLPVAARPIAVRSIVVPHIVAGALAIRRVWRAPAQTRCSDVRCHSSGAAAGSAARRASELRRRPCGLATVSNSSSSLARRCSEDLAEGFQLMA